MKHEIRIVGGLWRRTRLAVADRPGLRPTPDRVRETLFNWLGQDLTGWHVLDAFAGTGVLGFESASRGATRVVMIERDAVLGKALAAARDRLAARAVDLQLADAVGWMSRVAPASFDLVLLDPPFDAGLHASAIAAAAPLVRRGGYLYVEAPSALPAPPGFEPWRYLKAGAVHAHLWRRDA
jgi:16S rRNA (guanine966-N2)-methyltransferase